MCQQANSIYVYGNGNTKTFYRRQRWWRGGCWCHLSELEIHCYLLSFKGRSCEKTLEIHIYKAENSERMVKVYAMLNKNCNRTLTSLEFPDALEVYSADTVHSYLLLRKPSSSVARNLTVHSVDQERCYCWYRTGVLHFSRQAGT